MHGKHVHFTLGIVENIRFSLAFRERVCVCVCESVVICVSLFSWAIIIIVYYCVYGAFCIFVYSKYIAFVCCFVGSRAKHTIIGG